MGVSLFMDLDSRAVLFATEGRRRHRGAVRRRPRRSRRRRRPGHVGVLRHEPGVHRRDPRPPARRRGHLRPLPVVQALNAAVDEVRKAERRTRPELVASKYLWLKRPERLTGRQTERLAWLTRPSSRLATARAYRWRWDFDGFYAQPPELAKAYLARWCRGASRSRLEPIKRFVRMVDRHWELDDLAGAEFELTAAVQLCRDIGERHFEVQALRALTELRRRRDEASAEPVLQPHGSGTAAGKLDNVVRGAPPIRGRRGWCGPGYACPTTSARVGMPG